MLALCCVAFTATAGSAAEGEVGDTEELGSLLLHLRGRHGVQGGRTETEQNSTDFHVKDECIPTDSFLIRTTCASC